MSNIIPVERIEKTILLIRGQKVLLDVDLAKLYGVDNSQLKRAVRRNISRFPEGFMFELTKEELNNLRCHSGTSSWGGTRYSPFAFTEQGVAMLSSVLNSEKAIQINIAIIKAFVRMREMLASNSELARKLNELESKYDEQFKIVFDAIRQLMAPPPPRPAPPPKKKIGFHQE